MTIKQIHDAENDDDIKVVFAIDERMDLLAGTGFHKPYATSKLLTVKLSCQLWYNIPLWLR